MVIFPNAKINIGLHIIEKRNDGYHNIETCFVPIGWSDALEIVDSNTDTFVSTGLSIEGESSNNLCIRALQELRKDFDIPSIAIHLHKIIPMGAGLGGGSSDAAFMLKLLNTKFSLQLSNEKLAIYARKLGSDCAFFIENQTMYATKKGDIFSPISIQLSGYEALIVYPNVHVNTATAYAQVQPRKAATDLKQAITAPINTWKATIFNDFEKSVCYRFPIIADIKQKMYDSGAVYAAMSGSGSAVFGIFEKSIAKPIFSEYKSNITVF